MLVACALLLTTTSALLPPKTNTTIITTPEMRAQQMSPKLAKLAAGPGITVSGLSSGAFFTVQLSVAFSRLISNAGVVAGGAFNAAQGTAMQALLVMDNPEYINLPLIYSQIAASELTGMIDSTSAMKSQHNYIFAGTKDTTVNPANALILRMMYDHYGVSSKGMFDIPAEHAFITSGSGNPCDFKGAPFINNCDFNLVHDILTTFYPLKRQPALPRLSNAMVAENLLMLDQYLFVPPQYIAFSALNGINRKAFVYVPTACQGAMAKHQNLLDIIRFDKKRADDTEGGKGRLDFDKLRNTLWMESPIYRYFNGTTELDKTALLYTPWDRNAAFEQREQQPQAVEAQEQQCRVTISLHGCKQTVDLIGESYVRETGYLEYAEANNIITLFPQAQSTLYNPNSCWDWWGYTGVYYSGKYSVQGMTVMNMATMLADMQ